MGTNTATPSLCDWLVESLPAGKLRFVLHGWAPVAVLAEPCSLASWLSSRPEHHPALVMLAMVYGDEHRLHLASLDSPPPPEMMVGAEDCTDCEAGLVDDDAAVCSRCFGTGQKWACRIV